MRKRQTKWILLMSSMIALSATSGIVNAQTTTTSEASTTAETTITESTTATEYFSDRDLDTSYDQAAATKIALNGSTASIEGTGATLEGNIIKITQEGVYELTGTSDGLQVLVEVADTEKVQLVLNGVTMTNTEPPIYVNTGDKVFITLADNTMNTLSDSTTRVDESIDAVIFSRSDLTINGTGRLDVTGNFYNGIESKDDLKIVNTKVTVNAVNHALNANDVVNIEGATLDLTAGKDGIHAENDEDTTLGNIYLNPQSLTISATEDGIDAYNRLEIVGGEITVTQSDEGMEASVIHQTGGNVSITSTDDGLNASDGSSSESGGFGIQATNSALQIIIDGGTMTIDAEGDGIDSNGSITINGGELFVQGSQVGGNSAIDSDGGIVVNGGNIVAIGTADMAQGFTAGSSGQASIMANLTGSEGSTITISDKSGNVLATHTATKSFQMVQASLTGMVDGGTYTVSVDGNELSVTATSEATGMGGMPGGIPGGMQGGVPGGMPGEMPGADQSEEDSL